MRHLMQKKMGDPRLKHFTPNLYRNSLDALKVPWKNSTNIRISNALAQQQHGKAPKTSVLTLTSASALKIKRPRPRPTRPRRSKSLEDSLVALVTHCCAQAMPMKRICKVEFAKALLIPQILVFISNSTICKSHDDILDVPGISQELMNAVCIVVLQHA